MTHHPSYTPTIEQDSSEQRELYVQRLLDQARDAVDQIAALTNSSTLEVLQSMIEDAHEAIVSDLVEVAPGVTLPSDEAARYFERKALQADCARCQLEDRAAWLDADEYEAIEAHMISTPHSCHISNESVHVAYRPSADELSTTSDAQHDDLMRFVESRCELSSKIVIAHRRSSDDACERLTIGCCVDHSASGIDSKCETW